MSSTGAARASVPRAGVQPSAAREAAENTATWAARRPAKGNGDTFALPTPLVAWRVSQWHPQPCSCDCPGVRRVFSWLAGTMATSRSPVDLTNTAGRSGRITDRPFDPSPSSPCSERSYENETTARASRRGRFPRPRNPRQQAGERPRREDARVRLGTQPIDPFLPSLAVYDRWRRRPHRKRPRAPSRSRTRPGDPGRARHSQNDQKLGPGHC